MPLRSSLFSRSPALQSCLVSDAAHVVTGAKGPHVALIQSALVRLRFLSPSDAKVEVGVYGSRTSAAVLAYKRQFKIINYRYQTQADNIVGRMTIASLDHAIWVLDGGTGGPRTAARPGPHPPSPTPVVAPVAPAGVRPVAAVESPSIRSIEPFEPPLSNLPEDMQAAIRRSNDAKVAGKLMLFPFVAAHEGPLSAKELSARFGSANDTAQGHLLALYNRMKPFDIWKNVRIIVNVYRGTGSRGIFCEPFNHDAFLAQMTLLTTGPRISPDPNVVPVSVPLSDSKFCRDMFNVHGPRDSFREMVKQGPGLHICITQPAERANQACDLHIDDIQQGQVCSRGFCIPLVNGQTIEHLQTVGPWLVEEARKTFGKLF